MRAPILVNSLGISLYEMVTGQRPFQGDNDYAIMEAHLKEAPRPPSALQPGLSHQLDDIIVKSIAKDPAHRFQSADEFRDAIGTIRPVSARAATMSRNATMVDTAVPAAFLQEPASAPPAHSRSEASVNQPPSDHARTIVDTRTPSRPAVQSPRTSVPNNPAVQPPPPRAGHPGIYMILGGALVVVAMVGTGLYLRRAEATPGTAKDNAEAVETRPAGDRKTPGGPAQAVVTSQKAPQAAGSSTGTAAATNGVSSNHTDRAVALEAGAGVTERREPEKGTAVAAASVKADAAARGGGADASIPARTAEPGAAPQDPPKAPVNLDQLEHEIDQLSARAAAVNGSLNRLHEQQARQGLGLRGDIAARQESLNLNLSKADEAMRQYDGARAARYKALTEADVDALERFLGR